MELVVKLNSFEGPLDLLLHLIRVAEVNIEDIFVSQITEQYLAIIHEAEAFDMEIAGEFITMAATLIEIKSRSLLPKEKDDETEDEEGLSPEEQIIRQLQLYEMIKEVSGDMKSLESEGAGRRFKLPEELIPPAPELDLSGVTVDALFDAFENVLLRETDTVTDQGERVIRRETFTVPNRMAYMRRVIRRKKNVMFSELFDDAVTKEELVVTFLAMLELIRDGKIGVQQKGMFREILLTWIEEAKDVQ